MQASADGAPDPRIGLGCSCAGVGAQRDLSRRRRQCSPVRPTGQVRGRNSTVLRDQRCVHSPSEVSLTEQAASTGSLPFTGYVLLSVVALGLLLLMGGLSLRRMARPRHPDAP